MIVAPAVAHDPTGVLTPVVVSCAGIWSVTTTSRAMPGPWFLTSSPYVTLSPTLAVGAETDLTIETFGLGVSISLSSLLLSGLCRPAI